MLVETQKNITFPCRYVFTNDSGGFFAGGKSFQKVIHKDAKQIGTFPRPTREGAYACWGSHIVSYMREDLSVHLFLCDDGVSAYWHSQMSLFSVLPLENKDFLELSTCHFMLLVF